MRLRWTWTIGRIAGITVSIHPSWFIVYVLFAWSATVMVPVVAPQLSRTSGVLLGCIAALALFASVVAHEFAHALVARRLGIPIAGITLFLFGGVAMIVREPDSPRDELRVALAGPALSLVLAAAFATLATLANAVHWLWIFALSFFLAAANAMLAVFNLLPAFPSDGGRVLRALLWHWRRSQAEATLWASYASLAVSGALVVAGIVLLVVTREPRGTWWILIGLFLAQAAAASGRQARVDWALERMPVRECMLTRLIPVTADTPVATFLGEVAGQPKAAYPVVEGGTLVGLADVRHTAGLPLPEWEHTAVGAIMTPLTKTVGLAGAASARDALVMLRESRLGELPVYEDGELVGVVTPESIYRTLRERRVH
jgi:Zn-dependent protease/CBS domain-containing protein